MYSNSTSHNFLKSKLLTIMSNADINIIFKFHNFVDENKIPDIQINADILFLPLTTKTGYSKKLINTSSPSKFSEYLAAGRPIIVFAPEGSFAYDFVKDNNCGYTINENSIFKHEFFEFLYIDNVFNDIFKYPKKQLIKMKNARKMAKQFDIKKVKANFFMVL